MSKATYTFEIDREDLSKMSTSEWAAWYLEMQRAALYAITDQGIMLDNTLTVELIENAQVDGISLANRNTFLIRFEAEVFPHG